MAEAGTIDSLQIEIEASSKSAVQQINNLAKAFKNLKAATDGGLNIGNFKKELGKLGDNEYTKIEKLAQALQGLKNVKLDDKIGNSMLKIADACELIEQQHIDKLTKFGNALQTIKTVSTKGYDKLPAAILNIAAAVDSITDDSIARLSRLTIALSRLRGVDLSGLGTVLRAQNAAHKKLADGTGTSSPAVSGKSGAGGESGEDELTQRVRHAAKPATALGSATKAMLQTLVNDLKRVASAALSAAKAIGGKFLSAIKSVTSAAIGFGKNILIAPFQALTSRVKALTDKMHNLISSFKRIMFYRVIRTIIKEIGEAMKEGEENAYWYSKTLGTVTHYISEAYDRFASASAMMKNQVGAAWATMIAYVEPIIVRIINLVTRAGDAVTQFFAILSGKRTYLKAVDYNKQWAESAGGAAKAAKEWKNQLMGFDEINRLEEPSDGGGGGGGKAAPDYENMFEEAPVNDFFAEIRKAFESGEWAKLGTQLGQKFNEIVDSIKWAEYGQKLGKGLQASITTAYTFLKTADFKNLGSRISEFVNNALEQVNFSRLGRLWMRMRTALWDVIYGAVVNLNWVEVANKLSDFVIGALDELAQWLEELEPDKIAKALKDFFGNIKYEEIAGKLEEVLKSALDLVGDVVGELLPEDIGPNFRDGIVNAIKKADFAAIHNVLMYKLDSAVFGEKWANFWWSRGDYAGKDLVMSMITGMDIETGSLESTMKNDIENPTEKTLNNLKTITNSNLTTIQSDTGMILEGLKNEYSGLATFIGGVFTGNWSQAWSGIVSIMSGAIQTIFGYLTSLIDGISAAISWIRGLFDHMNSLANSNAVKIQADGSIYLQGFATGGFPEDGLFMANHGEMVGQFSNGRTAVANNEQIVEGIRQGVYDAVMAANSNGERQVDVRVYLDSREIKIGQNRLSRAMGV